jgi:hypothetical protein
MKKVVKGWYRAGCPEGNRRRRASVYRLQRTMAMMPKAMVLPAGLALAAMIVGCRVNVQKDANGQEKTVQVDTPFGGVHVNTDQTTAADLGLPTYPGAQIVQDNDKDKSADVHLGIGEWELRVRAVNYATGDTKEQVTAFYKKALGRYGDVIICQGNAPVGTPTTTTEGLTCDDNKGGSVKIDSKGYASGGLELKAGSRRHQHVVGFEDATGGKTRFVLVALDLPAAIDKAKSD